jgi:hypothetical protein
MGSKGAGLGGDNCVMVLWHHWFMTDSIYKDGNSHYEPAPDYLVGGPSAKDFKQSDIRLLYGEPKMRRDG